MLIMSTLIEIDEKKLTFHIDIQLFIGSKSVHSPHALYDRSA